MQLRLSFICRMIFGILLAVGQVFAQGLDVTVHFVNNSQVAGKLLSVRDTSVVLQFPDYPWDQRTQEVSLSEIKDITFSHKTSGEASPFTKTAGATSGLIVGAVAGAAIGNAVFPEPHGFIRIRWGMVGTTLLGAGAGAYLGATLANPPKSHETRFDPNSPAHRDSLRALLRDQ